MTKSRKVVLIGLDGLIPGMVKQFLSDTPHTERLVRGGVFARALPCMPTDTPTNWTTIATGADVLRHGVSGFHPRTRAYFDSNRCKAEFIWEAMERANRKGILINYPTAWPLRTRTTTVVGGDGIFSPHWRIGDLILYSTAVADERKTSVSLMDVCKTDVRITLSKADGWRDMPLSARPPLEARIPSIERKAASWSGDGYVVDTQAEAPVSGYYDVLLTASGSSGYDSIHIRHAKGVAQCLCTLRQGEWSDWILQDFDTPDGKVNGSFKFKLIELSPDGRRLRLYRTMASRTEGWTQPHGLAAELVANVGPYHEGWENSPMEMAPELGIQTLTDHARMQAQWLSHTASYLAAEDEWDLIMLQAHIQDSYNHRFMWKLEPLCEGHDPKIAEESLGLFRELYQITDNMIGEIVEQCADDDTVVIVVSDHGGFPMHTKVCIPAIFVKSGLATLRYDSETGAPSIDSSLSKYDGVKANAPTEAERRSVLDEVIQVLSSVRDPRTGENPFALLVRPEDLPSLGLATGGTQIHYFFKAGYTKMPLPKSREETEKMIEQEAFFAPFARATHIGLPTIGYNQFSNAGTFIISGAGIAEGMELSHPIHLKDVTPTICHLLGIAPPRHSEGRILWEVLT